MRVLVMRLIKGKLLTYLFCPLGMLADRDICSVCINFFLIKNDLLETNNYLRIYRADFHEIFTNDGYLIVDDRSDPLFSVLKGRCHVGLTNFSSKIRNLRLTL